MLAEDYRQILPGMYSLILLNTPIVRESSLSQAEPYVNHVTRVSCNFAWKHTDGWFLFDGQDKQGGDRKYCSFYYCCSSGRRHKRFAGNNTRNRGLFSQFDRQSAAQLLYHPVRSWNDIFAIYVTTKKFLSFSDGLVCHFCHSCCTRSQSIIALLGAYGYEVRAPAHEPRRGRTIVAILCDEMFVAINPFTPRTDDLYDLSPLDDLDLSRKIPWITDLLRSI